MPVDWEAQIHEHENAVREMAVQQPLLMRIGDQLIESLRYGGTVYLCGNGGLAALCQHVAAELVGTFHDPGRRGLRAVALTTDTSVLTAVGNDFDFSHVFQRQVEALVKPGDVVVGMTYRGSPNVVKALLAAQQKGAVPLLFSGAGCSVPNVTHFEIDATSPRVQEAFLLAWHLLCHWLDDYFSRSANPGGDS